jgi:hypothetical protein
MLNHQILNSLLNLNLKIGVPFKIYQTYCLVYYGEAKIGPYSLAKWHLKKAAKIAASEIVLK